MCQFSSGIVLATVATTMQRLLARAATSDKIRRSPALSSFPPIMISVPVSTWNSEACSFRSEDRRRGVPACLGSGTLGSFKVDSPVRRRHTRLADDDSPVPHHRLPASNHMAKLASLAIDNDHVATGSLPEF